MSRSFWGDGATHWKYCFMTGVQLRFGRGGSAGPATGMWGERAAFLDFHWGGGQTFVLFGCFLHNNRQENETGQRPPNSSRHNSDANVRRAAALVARPCYFCCLPLDDTVVLSILGRRRRCNPRPTDQQVNRTRCAAALLCAMRSSRDHVPRGGAQ